MKIETKLEVYIITYNRAAFLRKTLHSFLQSPMHSVTFHVLDNASTDDTRDVCTEYQQKLPSLNYFRHQTNCGFGANYVRCHELAKSEYVWIIGDDDDWDFTGFGELEQAITQGEHDLICIGGPGIPETFQGREGKLNLLVQDGFPAFHVFGFISSKIFKRSSVPQDFIYRCYRAIYFGYVENHLVESWIQNSSLTLVMNASLVRRNHESVFKSYLAWIHAWIGSCEFIDSPLLKQRAQFDPFSGSQMRFHKSLTIALIYGVGKRQKKIGLLLCEILLRLPIKVALTFLVMLPIHLIPELSHAAFKWKNRQLTHRISSDSHRV